MDNAMKNRFKNFGLLISLIFIAGFIVSGTGCGVAKDTQLQIKIKEALREDRNVSHDKLIVNVKDGIVTITGELGTQTEIDRVTEIVMAIEGVVELKNNITLPDDWHTTNPTFLDYGLI
ncbi:MAG TPA: BON domain-containing protein [Firmicutes bacterium]|nr:BON domain-containing protein [Bacillota bacterium]